MSSVYLSDMESILDLESRIHLEDQGQYMEFKHMRTDSGFIGRVYTLFNASKDGDGFYPEILTHIKIIDWLADYQQGAEITIEDLTTGEAMNISHVPQRVFNYDIFLSCPPVQRLRWDIRRDSQGIIRRSLAFGLLIKTAYRADIERLGVTYMETIKSMKNLYPNIKTPTQYI